MNHRAFVTRAVLLIGTAGPLAPPSAAAAFLVPLSTSVQVDASPMNGVADSRATNGNAPLFDALSMVSGLSTADSSASVDAAGIHVSAAIHSDISPGFSATARGIGGLVNPFILVPQPGFVGTLALISIPYTFGGSINLYPSLADCPSCFGVVQANLSVDGLADQFFFLGSSSQGTINNAGFFVGGVARGGTLTGLLPVNTELYLRAGLTANVLCQSDLASSCGAEALFGGSLAYTGFSPDAIDIVWGLTPAASAPEPAGLLSLGSGLLALLLHYAAGKRFGQTG